MKPTDTSEKELERLIVRHLAGISEYPPAIANTVQEPEALYGSAGYVLGRASDYNRDTALAALGDDESGCTNEEGADGEEN